mgnify:CR=1 FL=1
MPKVKPLNNVELKKMRAAGKLAAETLDFITPHVQPGVSTLKLNDLCHDFILKHNAVPAPLNYRGFPKSICTSVNDVVCHGIPSANHILKDGDIVNIDVTVIVDGYHGDTSRMFYAGTPSPEAKKLVEITYECMMAGIETIRSGSWLSNVGKAIEALAHEHNFGVVREFCGHGIGSEFHTDPMVLHYANNDRRYDLRLRKGMCFTVEPMINQGTWETEMMDDGWTAKTADRKLSAQFEHTMAVTENGVEIFTKSPAGYTFPPYE